MLGVCGFNLFNQLSCVKNLLCDFRTSVKEEDCLRNILDFVFYKVEPNELRNKIKVSFSWSYGLVYHGNSFWLCGFVNGNQNTIKEIKSLNGFVILQACCNREQVVCVTEGGGCWQYSLVNGQWKDLTRILSTEQHEEDCPREIVVKVCCGDTVTAVLTTKGEVYNMPNKLSIPGVKIMDIACGRAHILMLSDRGEVFTVGEGSRGQLGHGELEDLEEPYLVEGLAGLTVVAIASGGWHACAVTADGDLYSWGWNMAGQLGLNSKEPCGKVSVQAVPLVVDWPQQAEVRVTNVACGARHTVVLLDDSSVWGCGWNGYGQLALPGVESVDCMTKLPTPDDGNFQHVLCGPWNTCLLT